MTSHKGGGHSRASAINGGGSWLSTDEGERERERERAESRGPRTERAPRETERREFRHAFARPDTEIRHPHQVPDFVRYQWVHVFIHRTHVLSSLRWSLRWSCCVHSWQRSSRIPRRRHPSHGHHSGGWRHQSHPPRAAAAAAAQC